MDDDFEMNEEELMRMESEMLAEQAAAKLKKKLDAAKLKKELEDASKTLKEHKKKVEAMMSRSVKINLVVEEMCTFLENGIAAIDDERPEVDTDWIVKKWDFFQERLSEIDLEMAGLAAAKK